ncbi:hypothetical protein SEA_SHEDLOCKHOLMES_42 [Mycobacterium phage ShedlockHolmes]|uniref:DUF732 domain-containing protein n=1 Tax=Mycobacterium phage ShedlockHolmes TaxID=1647313 RepID=A0A0F6WF94_9CAUD|nr:hypothetical protein SEA_SHEDLOCKHOLMES_42 [Mycobacterium phage ShedlockHolmes]AKF15219.1 hypothetical protein SEA_SHEDLOCKHOLMES_42 [Mycobacterium phage ShedlockHolmes]
MKLATLALSAAAAAALTFAPVAHADESTYLSDLAEVGLHTNGEARTKALTLGYTLCSALYGGAVTTDLADFVERQTSLNWREADRVAVAAQLDLCPDTTN